MILTLSIAPISEAFHDVFADMASRVLEVKKGNGAVGAERVIKFIGTFMRFMIVEGVLSLLERLAFAELVLCSC